MVVRQVCGVWLAPLVSQPRPVPSPASASAGPDISRSSRRGTHCFFRLSLRGVALLGVLESPGTETITLPP